MAKSSGKQYRLLRKIASVPIVANGFAQIDLPRDYDYETIFLRLGATVDVATANATSVRAEAPCQILPRVEVVSDGKNTLYSAPLWFAALGNHTRKLLQSGARVVTPPSSPNIAAYAVEAIGAVDFMNADGMRPKDSNFRSSQLSLLQLRLTFGAAADIFVVGSAVVTFTGSPVVDVFVEQLVELPDAAGAYTSPIALKKVSFQELAVTASNANQELRLPAGNMIRSVFLRGAGNTTAGEPSTATFNNIQLAAGMDVRVNVSAAMLRAKNNADIGALTAGYYVADVAQRGNAPSLMSELWDVSGAAEPKVIMDVTGGANVKVSAVVTEFIGAR